MDIVNRARNIIVRPRSEWPIIALEPSSVGELYTKYLVPLGLIGPIASFVGLTVVGVSIPFIGTYRQPVISGLTSAIVAFIAVLAGVYIWSLIINGLAPTFSGTKDPVAALKVAVFAATPALLAGILSLLPALGILQFIATLYGLYLLYRGLPILMKTPPDKAFGYTALTVVCGIGVGIIIGALMLALHFSPFSGYSAAALSRDSDAAVAQGAIASAIGNAAGGSDESKAAAATVAAGVVAAVDAAKAAATAAPAQAAASDATAAPAAEGAASAAAGIAAIGTLVAGGKAHVAAVDFHALESLLPEAVGPLTRTDPHGERSNTAGLAVSTAEATYTNSGPGRVSLKITDMGNAGGILALGKLALTTESESDTGYEKNIEVQGSKVHEKWTAADKASELTTFVGDRFLVEVNGTGVEMPTAEGVMGAVDATKLAALKGP